MPTDDIFDDPNMNEMMMNPDLYGLDGELSNYGKMYDYDGNGKISYDEMVDEEDDEDNGV